MEYLGGISVICEKNEWGIVNFLLIHWLIYWFHLQCGCLWQLGRRRRMMLMKSQWSIVNFLLIHWLIHWFHHQCHCLRQLGRRRRMMLMKRPLHTRLCEVVAVRVCWRLISLSVCLSLSLSVSLSVCVSLSPALLFFFTRLWLVCKVKYNNCVTMQCSVEYGYSVTPLYYKKKNR